MSSKIAGYTNGDRDFLTSCQISREAKKNYWQLRVRKHGGRRASDATQKSSGNHVSGGVLDYRSESPQKHAFQSGVESTIRSKVWQPSVSNAHRWRQSSFSRFPYHT